MFISYQLKYRSEVLPSAYTLSVPMHLSSKSRFSRRPHTDAWQMVNVGQLSARCWWDIGPTFLWRLVFSSVLYAEMLPFAIRQSSENI